MWIVLFVSGGAGVYCEPQHVLAVEACINIGEIDEGAEKQACTNDKHQRKCYLQDHHGASEQIFCAALDHAAAFFERINQVKASCTEGGNGSEEERCGDGDAECE